MEDYSETDLEELECSLFSQVENEHPKTSDETTTATQNAAFLSNQPVSEGDPIQKICLMHFDLSKQSALSDVIPKAAEEFEVSGPPNAYVEMVHYRQPRSGGHHHGGRSRHPGAVGRLSPTRFRLGPVYPQKHRVRWDLPPTSGEVVVIARFSNGALAGGIATVHHVTGLVPLVQNQTLKLKSPTSDHLSPYWVKDYMKPRIEGVAKQFYVDTGLFTTCTDAALQFGGVFDLNKDWKGPHYTHNRGDRVDLRSNDQNAEQKLIFQRICAQNSLLPKLEFPGQPNEHWHVTAM